MTLQSAKDPKPGNEKSAGTPPRARTLRVGSIVVLLIGAAVSTTLIVIQNFYSVFEVAHRIGLGFLLILAIQISGIALNALAWRLLFRAERPGFTNLLFVIRWIRESINYLLPVGRIGGDVVAVRLLTARGRDANTVAAGVVADKTLEVLALFLFSLAGIVILFESGENRNSLEHWALRALGALLAVLIAFIAAQRWGLLKIVDKVVNRFSGAYGGGAENNSTGIHEAVWAIYRDYPRLIPAAFLHAIAWVPGAMQIWVAVRYLGLAIDFTGAFVIESLTMIICSAAFIMPASLGAQEAAYMTMGWWLFGIPPAAGLALSLIQRMKDVLFGITGLLVWQGFEGKHLRSLLKDHKASRSMQKRSQ